MKKRVYIPHEACSFVVTNKRERLLVPAILTFSAKSIYKTLSATTDNLSNKRKGQTVTADSPSNKRKMQIATVDSPSSKRKAQTSATDSHSNKRKGQTSTADSPSSKRKGQTTGTDCDFNVRKEQTATADSLLHTQYTENRVAGRVWRVRKPTPPLTNKQNSY